MTTHTLILAIALSWAGLDIAFLLLVIRRARLRDEATIRRRLAGIAQERRELQEDLAGVIRGGALR